MKYIVLCRKMTLEKHAKRHHLDRADSEVQHRKQCALIPTTLMLMFCQTSSKIHVTCSLQAPTISTAASAEEPSRHPLPNIKTTRRTTGSDYLTYIPYGFGIAC